MLLDVFNDVLNLNVTINALLISTGKMIPLPMTALAARSLKRLHSDMACPLLTFYSAMHYCDKPMCHHR